MSVSYTHLKLYTYAVLPEHQNAVRLGSMVLVPFGKGSRARMGVVLALSLIHIWCFPAHRRNSPGDR